MDQNKEENVPEELDEESKEMLKQSCIVNEQLTASMREYTQAIKDAKLAPIMFGATCDHCGKDTVQISHVARLTPEEIEVAEGLPLRTCLVCGLVTRKHLAE